MKGSVGGEVPPAPEALHRRREGQYRRRADRPDSRDAHQTPRLLVLVSARADPALQFPDFPVQAGDLPEQKPVRFASRFGQPRVRSRNGRRQPYDVGGTLGGDEGRGAEVLVSTQAEG